MIAINPDTADIIGWSSVALAATALTTEVEVAIAAKLSCMFSTDFILPNNS